MPELLMVFSKNELDKAHAWARGMGLSCRTRRQGAAMHMSGREFSGVVGTVGPYGDNMAEASVLVAGGSAAAGVRYLHIGGTLEEVLEDLETFINKIRGNGNGK